MTLKSWVIVVKSKMNQFFFRNETEIRMPLQSSITQRGMGYIGQVLPILLN